MAEGGFLPRTNLVRGKLYIGSTNNLERRLEEHRI